MLPWGEQPVMHITLHVSNTKSRVPEVEGLQNHRNISILLEIYVASEDRDHCQNGE